MSLAMLLLVACGEVVDGNTPGAKAPAPAAAVKTEAKKDDPGAAEVVPEYAYNPAGKRDPFQSFISQRSVDLPGESADQPPLQRWDVERYVLRGIIFGTDSPRAMLIDPEGVGHVVKLGSYVGRNWGKVTAIQDGMVVVTEEYKSIDDELVVNPVQLKLGAGGGKP
ncbi:MAG TPA: pilus assembly protein PilP [Myxococcota bacterium]|nr:pilus assembly protein PilP [Myxococcota bacterium]HNH47221.1 pilus assembly protein PilP [Myxococcota bacterium]